MVSITWKMLMVRHKISLSGLMFAIVFSIISIIFDLDLFEEFIELMESLEHWEVDEFVIPALILLGFVLVDLVKRHQMTKLELEKQKIYQAMLTSSHHILNNCLNQMQLIRLTAEATPGFNEHVLEKYDVIVADATDQIARLSKVIEMNEKAIKDSVLPID